MDGKPCLTNNRKMLILMVSILLLIVCVFVGRYFYKQSVIKAQNTHRIFNTDTKIDVVVEMGKGKLADKKEDAFLILNPEDMDNWLIGNIKSVSGQYVVFGIDKGEYDVPQEAQNYNYQVEQYEEAKLVLYDIQTRKLAKTFDIMEWIRKNPKISYMNSGYRVTSKENNELYLSVDFAEVLQEKESKVNYTGKTTNFVQYNVETGVSTMGKTTSTSSLRVANEQEMTWFNNRHSKEENKKWYNFKQKHKLEKFDSNIFSKEKNPKDQNWREEPRYLDVTTFRGVNGVMEINISSNALPKENKKLYERFPELKKYQKEEWRPVKIYLGGYLTFEDIQELLVDESK